MNVNIDPMRIRTLARDMAESYWAGGTHTNGKSHVDDINDTTDLLIDYVTQLVNDPHMAEEIAASTDHGSPPEPMYRYPGGSVRANYIYLVIWNYTVESGHHGGAIEAGFTSYGDAVAWVATTGKLITDRGGGTLSIAEIKCNPSKDFVINCAVRRDMR
jgi:hypothetical protein